MSEQRLNLSINTDAGAMKLPRIIGSLWSTENRGKVKFVINQVIERVLNCAGKKLPFQING